MNGSDADWLEVLWTIVAFIGFMVALYGVHISQRQVWFAEGAQTNGPRILVAKASRRREMMRAAAQGLYVIGGLAAMNRPVTPGPGRTLILALLLSGSAIIVSNSVCDLVYRGKLLACLDQVDREQETALGQAAR